jgi:hypothetical protein
VASTRWYIYLDGLKADLYPRSFRFAELLRSNFSAMQGVKTQQCLGAYMRCASASFDNDAGRKRGKQETAKINALGYKS